MWLRNDMFFTCCTMHHHELAQVLHTSNPLATGRHSNTEARGCDWRLSVDTTGTSCTTCGFPQPSGFRCVHNPTAIGKPLKTSAAKTTGHTRRRLEQPCLFSAPRHVASVYFTFSLLTYPKHQHFALGAHLRLREVSGIETALKGNGGYFHGH
ncbi:unannotated protein [freshwater metagenome]|uniref:Unannotated protein n=1 Tax=freshwater metagenome TaxID=449393 RepID=A0A6J7URB2_9ZZZZ